MLPQSFRSASECRNSETPKGQHDRYQQVPAGYTTRAISTRGRTNCVHCRGWRAPRRRPTAGHARLSRALETVPTSVLSLADASPAPHMCGAGRDTRVTTVFYLEVKLIIYLLKEVASQVGCAAPGSWIGPLLRAGTMVRGNTLRGYVPARAPRAAGGRRPPAHAARRGKIYMTRAQGDVLINWLSKRRGGTLCRQLSAAIAPLWAPFTRLSPRPEPAK